MKPNTKNLGVFTPAFVFFCVLINVNLTTAQVYPQETTMSVVDHNPPSPLPGYLESFDEENFGNKMTRVSSKEDFNGDNLNLRHEYSLVQPWNADESKLLLYKWNQSYILDGDDYSIINGPVVAYRRWMNTDPNKTYYFNLPAKLATYDVTTNTSTTIHNFADDGFTSIFFDAQNAELSFDDEKMVVFGERGSGNWYLALFNFQTQTIEAETPINGPTPDVAHLSWDKNYIVIGKGSGTSNWTGTNVYVKQGNQLVHHRHIANYYTHSDTAVDQQGNQVWVANHGDYIKSYRLDTGALTQYTYVSGGHISGRANNRPGWVYVTDHGIVTNAKPYNSYPGFREVYALKLDGKPNGVITVNRFAKHYTDWTEGYYHQAQACPNRDGTKVMFASNMDDPGTENQSYPFAWVAEMPQDNEGPVNANAGPDQTICEGENVTLTASGGGTYQWSNGATTQSITVSPNNNRTYTVTVSNGSSSDSDSVTVFVNDAPNANAGNNVTIDQGQSTTLTASGGGSYSWSTGSSSQSITVSPNSTTTYTVEVTNNSGCTDTDNVTVFVNNGGQTVANAGEDQTICSGGSATLTASGGGTYQWSNGANTASITVSPNSTTTYTVTVTNGGSSDTDSVTVFVGTDAEANAGPNQNMCAGDTVTLTASGGGNYLWSNGATTQSITVSPPSTRYYTVTVNPGQECSDSDSVLVIVSSSPNANAGSNVTINQGQSTTLTASGGGSYQWNTGSTNQSITVTPNNTTTYTVEVTNNGGCSDTDSVTVTVNEETTTADAGPDQTICEGESTTLTASGGGTYQWSNGATTQSITVSPNNNRTYTVTVSNGGSSDSDSATVFVNDLPNANAGNNVTINQGQSTTLTASGGGSYSWNTGSNSQSITVSPNSTTTYTVEVTNNSGCTDTDSVTVIVNTGGETTANAGEDQTICTGGSATLTATGGGTYQWSNGANTASITVSPNATTAYTVTVTNGGSSDTDSVTVFVYEEAEANAGPNQNMCAGESITLTASGGSSYLWSNGATTQSITVSPPSTRYYTVTVNPGGECSDSDSVLVIVNSAPNANAGNNVTINQGQSTTLTASGGGSYSWNTGSNSQSIIVSPNSTTTYTVEVTNDSGCTDTDSVTVIVNTGGETTANAGEDQTICTGGSATLTATGGGTYQWSNGANTASITVSPNATTAYTVTVTNGGSSDTDSVTVFVSEEAEANAGPNQNMCAGESITLTASGGSSYLWSNGATTQSITVSPPSTRYYTVTVNPGGECSDSDSVLVIVNSAPNANAGNNVTIDSGESTILTATGGVSYQWSNGAITSSITVSPNSTTTYTVEVTNNSGCIDTDSVTVIVNSDATTANAGEDQTICPGGSAILTASGGGTYQWNNGATSASITVNPNSTTTYTVTVSNGGSSDSDSVTVFVANDAEADAGPNETICRGDSVVLTASGGSSYLWNNGATTQSITVSPASTRYYTVTVNPNQECSDSDSVLVIVKSLPNANAGNDATIDQGESVTLTASGGTTYQWSNGSSAQSITVSPNSTTVYTVEVTNNSGCTDTDSVAVNVSSDGTASAGGNRTMCEGDYVILTAAQADTYLWSTGETTQSIEVSPEITTIYSLTVTNNGVEDTDEAVVFVNEKPNVMIVNGDEEVIITNGEYITLSVEGADSYLWSNGATEAYIAINPQEDTIIYVEGFKDDTGCSAMDEIVIRVVEEVEATVAEDFAEVCIGDSITLTAYGGDTYLWSTGETTQSIEVTPTEDIVYTVTVSNTINSDVAQVEIKVQDCSQQNSTNTAVDFEFALVPNPASSILKVNLGGLYEASSISVFDILGKQLHTESFDSENGAAMEKQIDVSQLHEGVYLVRLDGNGESISKRLIIKR